MTLLSLLRIYVNRGSADPEMTREAAELMLPISAGMNEKAQLFIAQCLFLGEDYEKLITFLDQMPDSRFEAGFKVAAVSVKQGSQKGLALLNTVPHADRDLALAIAIEHLSAGRHYNLVLDFMDTNDFQKGERRRVIKGSIRTTLIAIDALEKGSLLVPERLADSVSLLKYAIKGNDKNVYRVGLVLNDRILNVYLVNIDGELKVVATDDCPGFLGAEALRLLDSDNPLAARQFVQWGFEILASSTTMPNGARRAGLDPITAEPLMMLWSAADAKTANPNKTRLAAIALSDPECIADPMSFLTSIRKNSRPAEQRQIDRLMLYWCSSQEQTTECLQNLERMALYPQARDFYQSNRPQMLFNDKQYSEAKSFVTMQMRQKVATTSVHRFLARIALAQGHPDEAIKLYRRIADRADATSHDFNRAAWASLFLNELDEPALTDAIKATDDKSNPAGLYRLATMLAEIGKTEEAML